MQLIRLIAVSVLTVAGAAAAETRALRVYRDFAVRRDGNVERGRALFFATDRAACAACHTIDGNGGKAGPDLFAAGDTFPRRDLIEAILAPSATIAVGYGATIVETNSGDAFHGVIQQADASGVALMGADGTLVRVAAANIKAQRESPLSLMPEGLHTALSLQEFADLVEFLASLKQPANSLTANNGMPAEILPLAKPVKLRPLLPEALRSAAAA